MEKPAEELRLSVRYGQEVLEISLPSSARASDLMDRLQSLTNVLPRGQKLIHKGKILAPDSILDNGAKIMMIATQGTHQGPAPKEKEKERKLKIAGPKPKQPEEVPQKRNPKNIVENWKSTGIVSLRASRMLEFPEKLLSLGKVVRVLDLTSCTLKTLPSDLSAFTNLKKLLLGHNCLDDAGFLSSLHSVEFINLQGNSLTSLPIQHLSQLKQIDASKNKLSSLPEEIGMLSRLERANFSNNSLREIPASIGHCSALANIDFSSNFLTVLPPSISELRNLKSLYASNNALKDFPSIILKQCLQLDTIDLHGNPITLEVLREVDGWKEFDARRKAKYDKQIEFQVMGSSDGFDEGADAERTRHW